MAAEDPRSDHLGHLAGVVEEHDAYNAHDLDRYTLGFAPDALMLDGDGKTMSDGRDAIRTDIRRVFDRMPDGSRAGMQRVALYRVVHEKPSACNCSRALGQPRPADPPPGCAGCR